MHQRSTTREARVAFAFLLPVLVFFTTNLCQPTKVHAAEVTSLWLRGFLPVQAPGRGTGDIELTGPDVFLQLLLHGPPSPMCSPPSIVLSPSAFDAVAHVHIQGITTMALSGGTVFRRDLDYAS